MNVVSYSFIIKKENVSHKKLSQFSLFFCKHYSIPKREICKPEIIVPRLAHVCCYIMLHVATIDVTLCYMVLLLLHDVNDMFIQLL